MSGTSPAGKSAFGLSAFQPLDTSGRKTATTTNTFTLGTPNLPTGSGVFGGGTSTSAFGTSTTLDFGQAAPGVPITTKKGFGGLPAVTQETATSPPFGGGNANPLVFTGGSVQAASFGSALLPSDPIKQKRMEEFTRKFLLGEELVNAQFHVFSARSLSLGKIIKPRVLFANNLLLAKSSNYFLDLLSLDIDPTNPSLAELLDDNDVPSNIPIDDYGYGSDSDLDDDDDPVLEASKVQPMILSFKSKTEIRLQDGNKSNQVSESVGFVKDGTSTVTNGQTVIKETLSNKSSKSHGKMCQNSSGGRHILVKDTAFQTWYTLLNYLSTGSINFLPLSSVTPGGRPSPSTSTSSLDEPRCSAKSMYRLACKVGLDDLRDQALAHIRSNLKDYNILDEISCNLVSSHPQLLSMELDKLYSYIGTPPIVANFPILLRRIANNELPHGADIMTDIHSRLLKELHPFSASASPPPTQPSLTFPISAPRTHARARRRNRKGFHP